MIEGEKLRKRDNGENVYYRELFLPSQVLAKVYIKDYVKKDKVKDILNGKNFKNIEVEIAK